MSADEVKRILYVQTSGVESPARSATVFFLAASAAAMDVEVGLYFTQTGPPLSPSMARARDRGVRFYVCQPSLDLNDLKMGDLIDGVEMIGGAAFNNMALEYDRVICF